ncbi:MAG: class I adenylate-forming enzyme family protein [Planctomycetales bacterium]
MNEIVSPARVRRFLEQIQEVGAPSGPTPGGSRDDSIARCWHGLGLRPGDLVLLSIPNGLPLLEQFFAILSAGLVPVLIPPATPSARLRELVEVFRVRAVGAMRVNAAALGAHRVESVGPIQVAVFGEAAPPAGNPGEVVLMTSGTSGFASACVFGFEDLLRNASRHAESIGQRESDVVLVCLPLYYSFALVAQMLGTFEVGGRMVIDGPPFHPARYIETLTRFGITISSLTPVHVRTLLESRQSFPAATRVLSIGGDALSPEHVARLLELRPGGELYLTYGLTQAGPRVSTLAAHAEPPRRYASVGKPLSGTQVALEPITGDGGLKQLLVTSSTVMKRRMGVVEGRAANDLRGPGTIATGDVFEQDGEGYLYFQGRMGDYIVRGGEKICLAAVKRIATQLAHVVLAKTQIERTDAGDDFDLTLSVSTVGADYEADLRKLLRRTEMPRKIVVEIADHTHSARHK